MEETAYVRIPAEGDVDVLPHAEGGGEAWRFSPIRLWPGVVAYVLLSASLPLTLYLAMPLYGTRSHALKAATTAHAGLLLATMVLERYLRVVCKRKQMQGYLLFYRDMRTMLLVPTRVVAIGTALLQVLVVYSHHARGVLSAWGRSAFLLGMVVELAIVSVVLAVVLHRAAEHNTRRPLPDVAESFSSTLHAEAYAALSRQQPLLPAAPLAPHWAEGEDVSEKQAELIQFLLQRLRHVSRELMWSKARGGRRGDADGKPSSEWRTLEATVATQVEKARVAAHERADAVAEARAAAAAAAALGLELAAALSTQHQLVDELARYRAMLTEWSLINAKLELKVRSLEQSQQPAAAGMPSLGDEGERRSS